MKDLAVALAVFFILGTFVATAIAIHWGVTP